jgi:hypothetical protein
MSPGLGPDEQAPPGEEEQGAGAGGGGPHPFEVAQLGGAAGAAAVLRAEGPRRASGASGGAGSTASKGSAEQDGRSPMSLPMPPA